MRGVAPDNERDSNSVSDKSVDMEASSMPPPSVSLGPDRSRPLKRQAEENPSRYSFKNRSSSGSCSSPERLKEYSGKKSKKEIMTIPPRNQGQNLL